MRECTDPVKVGRYSDKKDISGLEPVASCKPQTPAANVSTVWAISLNLTYNKLLSFSL